MEQRQQDLDTQGDGHKGKGYGNTAVVKLRGQTQLPMEYMIPGKTFEDALARTTLPDRNQLNAIIQLYDWMESFDENERFRNAKQSVVDLLVGYNALNGFNRSLAAMTHTGIYLPEGAGIKMSKEDRKAFTESQRMRETNRNERGEERQQE